MTTKALLLKLNDDGNWENFFEHIHSQGRIKPKSKSNIEEALGVLSRHERETVWKSIFDKFTNCVQLYLQYTSVLEQGEPKGNHDRAQEQKNLLMMCILLSLGNIQLNVLIEEKAETSPPKKFVQFTALTASLLSDLYHDNVRDSAIDLCETWILNELEGFEDILKDTLKCLIEKCVKVNGKRQDVRRAYVFRKGIFPLASHIDESNPNDPLKKLLLSCATKSLFLNIEEGVKILSTVFSIPCIMAPFHDAVKRNLVEVTHFQSVKYAEVYFRAWKNNTAEVKQEIERKCLQDIMYLAVHVDPSSARLSSNLSAFLHYIHQHKKHLPTATVLYNLYEPFLWRSLKVANGYVRMNAAGLLCDLFPCTDISLSQEEKDELMEQQYRSFLSLLVDPCHLVRIVTAKGVFSILTNFWLLVPPNIIQKIFQVFLNKLIVDASTAELRMIVVQGIAQLLDCPEAGSYISKILPHICGSFDDVNTCVRIAFMKLLLKVKATRFIKYWKLVPMEHLLSRLAIDVQNVKTLISQLIISSFLPAHLDDQEKLQRCISLIELNREGARSFYQNVSKKLDVEATTRFIAFIWSSLGSYVQRANASQSLDKSTQLSTEDLDSSVNISNKKHKSLTSHQNKENEDESEESSEMPLDNPVVVGGLLDTIVILWTVNASRLGLPQNKKYLEHLKTRVSRSFPSVWSFFKDNGDISIALLYLSSFLPKSHVSIMNSFCLSRLKEIQNEEALEDHFGTYVNALCNWNRLDDLMELISDGLESAFSSVDDTSSSKTKSSKRSRKSARVCFDVKSDLKPEFGLRILTHILLHPLNKLNLMRSSRKLLVQLRDLMESVKVLLEKRFESTQNPLSSLCSDSFLLSCWSDYLCVIALLNHQNSPAENGQVADQEEIEEFDSLANFKESVQWIIRINSSRNESSSFDDRFFLGCLSRLMNACSDLVAIGIADESFVSDVLNLNKISLAAPYFDVSIFGASIRTICHLHNHLTAYSNTSAHLIPSTSVTCQAMFDVLDAFYDRKELLTTLPNQDLNGLAESLSSAFVCLSHDSDVILRSLSSRSLKIALELLADQLDTNPESAQISQWRELNGALYLVVFSSHKKNKISQSLLQALTDGIGTEIKHIRLIFAGVVLLSFLLKNLTKTSKESRRQALRKVQRVIDEIEEPALPEPDEVTEPMAQNLSILQKLRTKLEEMKQILDQN